MCPDFTTRTFNVIVHPVVGIRIPVKMKMVRILSKALAWILIVQANSRRLVIDSLSCTFLGITQTLTLRCQGLSSAVTSDDALALPWLPPLMATTILSVTPVICSTNSTYNHCVQIQFPNSDLVWTVEPSVVSHSGVSVSLSSSFICAHLHAAFIIVDPVTACKWKGYATVDTYTYRPHNKSRGFS